MEEAGSDSPVAQRRHIETSPKLQYKQIHRVPQSDQISLTESETDLEKVFKMHETRTVSKESQRTQTNVSSSEESYSLTAMGVPYICASDTSSETDEQDWTTFFNTLDAQNAQMYEVEGSNSDASDDLDMFLNMGYSPLKLSSPVSERRVMESAAMTTQDVRKQSITRQQAFDHDQQRSVSPFPFNVKDGGQGQNEGKAGEEDPFDILFNKGVKVDELEEYDNVPSSGSDTETSTVSEAIDIEQYDNVMTRKAVEQEVMALTSKEVTEEEKVVGEGEQSKEFWKLRSLLASQDKNTLAKMATGTKRVKCKLPSEQPAQPAQAQMTRTDDVSATQELSPSLMRKPQELEGVIKDQKHQIEKLGLIKDDVHSLLTEVESIKRDIRASLEQKSFSDTNRETSSEDESNLPRSRSLEDLTGEPGEFDRRQHEERASSHEPATLPSSKQSSGMERLDALKTALLSISDPSFDGSRFTTEGKRVPKSCLKRHGHRARARTHTGIVRFEGIGPKPRSPKSRPRQVSTRAGRTSPPGRSPPAARKYRRPHKNTKL